MAITQVAELIPFRREGVHLLGLCPETAAGQPITYDTRLSSSSTITLLITPPKPRMRMSPTATKAEPSQYYRLPLWPAFSQLHIMKCAVDTLYPGKKSVRGFEAIIVEYQAMFRPLPR